MRFEEHALSAFISEPIENLPNTWASLLSCLLFAWARIDSSSRKIKHWMISTEIGTFAEEETPERAVLEATNKEVYTTTFFEGGRGKKEGVPGRYSFAWKLVLAENGVYYWASPRSYYKMAHRLSNYEAEAAKKRNAELGLPTPDKKSNKFRTTPTISPLVSLLQPLTIFVCRLVIQLHGSHGAGQTGEAELCTSGRLAMF